MPTIPLIPFPQKLTPTEGRFRLPKDIHIQLQDHPATKSMFAAERFILEAESLTGLDFHLAVGTGIDPSKEIRVLHDDSLAPKLPAALRDQAYTLDILPSTGGGADGGGGITIKARTAAGTFYAFQTLLQLIRIQSFKNHSHQPPQSKSKNPKSKRKPFHLPALSILDYPNFPKRGVYHDTARGKVPTVQTLLQLIDDLGHLKYNEFQLYIENNFQFRKHPEMYDDTTPFTAEELLLLDEACRARHIDFVPSLTSLGHFEKILNRPKFRALAEAEPAQLKAINATCWFEEGPWSLCVTDPGAWQLLRDMYNEFAPNFSSKQFNICCDEAYDLGVIRSKDQADKLGGVGPLYVQWINFCRDLAKDHGKSIQMWGDIILKYPDLISQLPEDAVLLEWGYEHDHKFEEHCTIFAERLGISPNGQSAIGNGQSRSFYVSPGTSSWLTLASRSKNACGNIHSAATAGLKHGASGLLVTDWGDNGHQQLLAVSLTQFAYGAAASWNLQATPNPYNSELSTLNSQFLRPTSLHLFQDPTGKFASLAYDLGLTYLRFSWQRFNASLEWYLLREKWDFANYVNRAEANDLPKVEAACANLIPQFLASPLQHPDADLLKAEFVFTCREVIHACRRTALRKQWLAADPATRNPEEPTKRDLPPVPLPKTYRSCTKTLHKDALSLSQDFATLWDARNKPSRKDDVLAEFHKIATDYLKFPS